MSLTPPRSPLIFDPDRVFGHALNTVNEIRPGSQKPPATDRLALYGLYKQSMEGDVAAIAEPPTNDKSSQGLSTEALKKEQEKWDAWKANEGLSRTEAKRRYIELLIRTMHEYASGTDEARELVEELEFVWDQIKNNSLGSSSERSSPLQNLERSGYLSSENDNGGRGVSSSAAALDYTPGASGSGGGGGGKPGELRILSPVSQVEEDEEASALEEEREEFVDAPVSQVDVQDIGDDEEMPSTRDFAIDQSYAAVPRPAPRTAAPDGDPRWRKRIESSLMRLTTEVAALREQLESRRFLLRQRKHSFFGWAMRIGWWFVQFIVADAVVLWVLLFYLRRRQDRRLEGAIRVLLGDAVAQVQKVGREVKMPQLPKIPRRKGGGGG